MRILDRMSCVGKLLWIILMITQVLPFEWSVNTARPQVDRKAIAGIWRLAPVPALQEPMKEFTVYPKRIPQITQSTDDDGFLLMLKEDGSFQQYESTSSDSFDDDEAEAISDNVDLSQVWSKFKEKEIKKKEKLKALQLVIDNFGKGVWDYVDGKLILAADRPEVNKQKMYDAESDGCKDDVSAKDRLFEGVVVATYQAKLQENPVLAQTNNKKDEKESVTSTAEGSSIAATKNTTKISLDTHLSVPKGTVKIGKFFYPKNHPSFFEQPMFKPVKQGTFALRQILGSLNTGQGGNEEQEDLEKFRRTDFYNKTFLLTTYPIGRQKPKGDRRWSIKFKKYVYDSPSSQNNADNDENDESGVQNIRVMQVKFFTNNTFSSTFGLGSDVILRGKYDVIGDKRDHLWFQVLRFGFGRSVSGSVYSEGRMLSQDDCKAYWGKITIPEEELPGQDKPKGSEESNDSTGKILEVNGSVMLGWELEPLPVARFIMREIKEDDLLLVDDDEEDDEDDAENSIDEVTRLNDVVDKPGSESDGIYWSTEEDGMFQ